MPDGRLNDGLDGVVWAVYGIASTPANMRFLGFFLYRFTAAAPGV